MENVDSDRLSWVQNKFVQSGVGVSEQVRRRGRPPGVRNIPSRVRDTREWSTDDIFADGVGLIAFKGRREGSPVLTQEDKARIRRVLREVVTHDDA